MSNKTFDSQSRLGWSPVDGNAPDTSQLILGCLQRIAAANESLARRNLHLESEIQRLAKALGAVRKRVRDLERGQCPST